MTFEELAIGDEFHWGEARKPHALWIGGANKKVGGNAYTDSDGLLRTMGGTNPFVIKLNEPIAELEKPKETYWTELEAGTFFYFRCDGADNVCLRDDGGGYTHLTTGKRYSNTRSAVVNFPAIICDINGNPL